MSGYIKLYRSLMDWEWYQDGNTLRVFLHLLLDANHKQKKWKGIEVQPGQTITSYESISSKTGISVQSVRTSIKRLKSTGELTSKSTNRYTLITVENWESYQNDTSISTSESTGNLTINQQSTNKQLTTNKNVKNEKKRVYTQKMFKKPSVEDVSEYCKERKNNIDAQRFIDYYEANGWMVGRSKMKNWKAAVRNWESRSNYDNKGVEVKKKKYVN